MQKPIIKEVYPVAKGEFVTVPSESWNTLCTVVNTIIDTLNEQSEVINQQTDKLNTHNDYISQIAKAVEELYEKTE